MIRFNCPHCNRLSEVPPALARLPLLCKGCGQPLVVPETSTVEPEPPPPPPPRPAHKPPVLKIAKPVPVPPPEPEAEPELVEEPPPKPAPKPRPPARRKPPPGPEPAPEKPRRPRANPLPVVADVCVALLLLLLGAYLGELLARKPTAQVWRDAGSAVTFPPEELILWLGPPSVLVLTYALLASKGRGVGGWLKRRAGQEHSPAIQ
ncbi:unnamed protein product [Gemmataceae bacterium]|nr:unnamed protein product [Gemmataceae bacterium]VTU00076.1 unnamed protein product [Gemmataceae bacterium]